MPTACHHAACGRRRLTAVLVHRTSLRARKALARCWWTMSSPMMRQKHSQRSAAWASLFFLKVWHAVCPECVRDGIGWQPDAAATAAVRRQQSTARSSFLLTRFQSCVVQGGSSTDATDISSPQQEEDSQLADEVVCCTAMCDFAGIVCQSNTNECWLHLSSWSLVACVPLVC